MCKHKWKKIKRIGLDVAYECKKCGDKKLEHKPPQTLMSILAKKVF
jgi:hypothetical protein